MLISTVELPGPDPVSRTNSKHSIVRDGSRQAAERTGDCVSGSGIGPKLVGGQRVDLPGAQSRPDGILVVDFAAEEVHRQTHIVEADIAFEGIADGAVIAVAQLRFRRQT